MSFVMGLGLAALGVIFVGLLAASTLVALLALAEIKMGRQYRAPR